MSVISHTLHLLLLQINLLQQGLEDDEVLLVAVPPEPVYMMICIPSMGALSSEKVIEHSKDTA